MAYETKKTKINDIILNVPTKRDRRSGRLLSPDLQPVRILTRHGIEKLFTDTNTDSFEALSELMTKGYIQGIGGRLNIETKCEIVLAGIGFVPVENEELSPGLANMKNFSLIGSVNIDETIKNSKIIDPDINLLTPVKIEAIEKIKSEDDPFYELDEQRSDSIKRIVSKQKLKDKKKLIRLAKTAAKVTRRTPNKMLDVNFKRGDR